MPDITLPDGTKVPQLGQGTWRMGEDPRRRADEIAALRRGVELGLTLIDTAEMYGDGAAESLMGEALAGLRDRVFIVSKVFPQNAGGRRLAAACEASLRRLGTDHIDLYLLHWPGGIPLSETVAGMESLREAGKIRAWGVSNFDVEEMQDLLEAGGTGCATNQVLYNLKRRGPEFDLLPWQAARAMPVMAYSPIEQGRLPATGALAAIAAARGVPALQVALAWVLRDPQIIAIPKSGRVANVEANAAAASLALTSDELAALDTQFPPPRAKVALEML